VLTTDARDVVKAHVETLVGQLDRIIADGIAEGSFEPTDPTSAGRAVFDATARFHNPAHAAEWSDPGIDTVYKRVSALIIDGLTTRHAQGPGDNTTAATFPLLPFAVGSPRDGSRVGRRVRGCMARP
jgi:Tetracyclin repressor-like, C-terminal domain